jgi:hypothetical protein
MIILVAMTRVKNYGLFAWCIGLAMVSTSFISISFAQNLMNNTLVTPPGWTDDIDISNSGKHDKECQLVSIDKYIHVVWVNNFTDIVYARSEDSGKSWSPFITIYHSSVLVFYPDIAAAGACVHIVWGNIESNGILRIYYRNSTNNGVTWNVQKIISSPTGFDAKAPRILINNLNVSIVWNDFRDGSDGEVYYRRSIDGGITFDNGQGVNADRRITYSPAAITKPSIEGNRSNISIAWMDERNGDFDVYWKISKDNGNTWEDGLGNIGVDRRLTFTGVYDYALAVNGSKIYIVWSNQEWPGPVYRLYYCNSIDDGATWSPPILLTGPTPFINSPDIATFGNSINIVWDDMRDDGTSFEIYYKNSTDGGISWSGEIRLTYYLGDSLIPRIALNNTARHVIWQESKDGNREIYYKRSPDFPDTSPPTHSNETPSPDSYKDPPGTNISVRVTDQSGVNASSIQLYVNGSIVTHSLTPIAGGFNVSYASLGFSPGVISCRIVADDNCSNHLDYTWNFTVLNSFKIPVVTGWNLVSTPLVQPNSDLPGALLDRHGDTQWDRVMCYNASDGSDHWKQFNINWSPPLNDLKNVNNMMGLWLNVTFVGDGFLNVTGLLPITTQVPLMAGWNLVGYPSLSTNMTVADALWGTGADMVEVFDLVATYRTKVVGPTYIMKPGEGYWVHVVADSVWTVDW